MKRSFRDLTLEEILALAIRVEENNAARIQSLEELYADYDRDLQKYFHRLRLEELDHKRLLERKWEERFGDRPLPEIDEGDIREVVEAVDVFHGEHLLFDDFTPDLALVMIHNTETAAYLFYLKAAAAVEDMEIKNLLSELASFEFQHMENVPRFKPVKKRAEKHE
jgi:rubrerythrin